MTDKIWGIWVIFGQTISTQFGTVSPLSIFFVIQPLFLQKISLQALENLYTRSRINLFSTDCVFRQQENLNDNHKCQAGFRPLCNKILLLQNKPIVHIANVLSVNTVQIVLCWLKVLSTYNIHITYYICRKNTFIQFLILYKIPTQLKV